jgi:repressor LexA
MSGRNYRWLEKEMLTPKQLKLFKFLLEYKKKHEVMPKFDEMLEHMNVKSKNTIHHMLGYIEWKGYIKRYPAHARAITILKEVA